MRETTTGGEKETKHFRRSWKTEDVLFIKFKKQWLKKKVKKFYKNSKILVDRSRNRGG